MNTREIQRHKTAIRRGDFSRPVKCLLRHGLIGKDSTLFDYGCGRGEDMELLAADGIACSGWDPAYRPDTPLAEADVVNLGYVINVIEDPDERASTLRKAWSLCRQLLVVSAQVKMSGRGKSTVEFGDGVLTGRGTFQKFFEQAELKSYVETVLETDAIPTEIGIFYLFKDETRREQFLANCFRRREIAPRRRMSELRFEENRELLDPFMAVVTSLGRLPDVEEWPQAQVVAERFGSLKRAFAFVQRITGTEEWELIARRRTEDILVYLALARFHERPRIASLPLTLQRDMRAFFGSYAKACVEADDLLFKAGDGAAIDEACGRSGIGKILPDDLYVHRSALDSLEPILRIYEGCGRAYLGEVEGANLVKIHRRSGKLSYLAYPDFDTNPHPALALCVRLSLRTRKLDCYDYAQIANPPILHRKETFLRCDNPLYEKFARLTRQEERHGLLVNPARIGTRLGWENRLSDAGFTVRGHRLIRRVVGHACDGTDPEAATSEV
jgi:DNA phosphorothioation-associated putative methyltransferase